MVNNTSRNAILLVFVAALGFFVDVYDLLLFSIVRVRSLHDIGIADADLRLKGVYVINMQMAGLLLGGILWGIIGDKFGRVKVLFGSILWYSLANFANGMVHDVDTYAFIRFVAGIGLAGELGAGITLVSETLSKEKRGYGSMVIAMIGLLGAVAAVFVARYDWRTAYFVGGGLGILLLLIRMRTFESGMFNSMANSKVVKGNIWMLFNNRKRFFKYLYCILIGSPQWFIVGILVTQAREFGVALGAKDTLDGSTGILYLYIGLSTGGIFTTLFAQYTKSRKLTMFVFQILSLLAVVLYLSAKGISNHQFLWLCAILGTATGYWAIFATIAAEQFGTNIRATVTTTASNFVRGLLIPINWAFNLLEVHFGMITSGYIIMIILTLISFLSLSQLKETFGKDLNYVETVD